MSNATPSTQPLAANDARPPRAPVFTSRASAEAYAIRSAQNLSRVGLACPVEFVEGAYQPKGGGTYFVVESVPGPLGESVVRELSPIEVSRRQQAGLRYAIELLHAKARVETKAALAAKTPTFVRMHAKWAREARLEARELELRLTVGGVRAAGAEVGEAASW